MRNHGELDLAGASAQDHLRMHDQKTMGLIRRLTRPSVVRNAASMAALASALLAGCQATRDYPSIPSRPPDASRASQTARPTERQVAIMGAGQIGPARLAGFLRNANPSLKREECRKIAQIYVEEARAEGVNSDVAFCQMCLETNFLKYGGDVEANQRNFSGLGATGGGVGGATFYTVRSGIRAHIQHLKAYASKEPLNHRQLDPRFHLVSRGSAPYVSDLAGTWATDPQYGDKILSLLRRLRGSGSPEYR